MYSLFFLSHFFANGTPFQRMQTNYICYPLSSFLFSSRWLSTSSRIRLSHITVHVQPVTSPLCPSTTTTPSHYPPNITTSPLCPSTATTPSPYPPHRPHCLSGCWGGEGVWGPCGAVGGRGAPRTRPHTVGAQGHDERRRRKVGGGKQGDADDNLMWLMENRERVMTSEQSNKIAKKKWEN